MIVDLMSKSGRCDEITDETQRQTVQISNRINLLVKKKESIVQSQK